MDEPPARSIQGPLSLVVLSQVAMAASAAALVFACSQVLDRSISPWWYAAAFLGSWAVYLRDSAASCDAEDSISQPRRAALFRGSRTWCAVLPLLGGALGVACGLVAGPRPITLALLGAVGVLGLLHALPSDGGRVATKRFAAAKSIVVSIAWGLAAVGLPLLEGDGPTTDATWTTAGWLVVLLVPVLLADSLLLDLRDRIADRTFGLRTIAVRVGPRDVHAAIGILLAVSAATILLGASSAVDPSRWLRIGLATTLGMAVAWAGWRGWRGNEAGLAAAVMAWRFLAALATI